MTVMFHDIHKKLDGTLIAHRIPGANFDEVMYADDTVCISTDTRSMNLMIAEIEVQGRKYGLKLNKNKCETMSTASNVNVHFQDGSQVKRTNQVTYLGCEINQNSDYRKELSKRISATMAILKKLDLFWRHSDCPTKFKMITLDAVVRSKLLYGLDSAQLNEQDKNRLDTFHLKAIRKILKMKTTFIDRRNTNLKVYRDANTLLQQEGGRKTIKSFKQIYACSRIKRLKRTINKTNTPMHKITFESDLTLWTYNNRRVGRPKYKWAEQALKSLWSEIQHAVPQHAATEFNTDNQDVVNLITDYAKTNP